MDDDHELAELNMQEWEDLCRYHPISSRDLKTLLEDTINEVDAPSLEHFHRPKNNKKNFLCTRCERNFTRKYDLQRHMKIHTREKGYGCYLCPRMFYRKDKLRQHQEICQRKVNDDQCSKEQCPTQVIANDCGVFGNTITAHEYHFRSNVSKNFVCTRCNKHFTRKFDLQRHMKIHAREKEFQCSTCTKTFHRCDKKLQHEQNCRRLQLPVEDNRLNQGSMVQVGHGESSPTEERENDVCESALNRNLKTVQMKPRINEKHDLTLFLKGKKANIFKNLKTELKEKKGVKWFISVQVKMVKYRPDGQDEFATPHFRGNCQRLTNFNALPDQYEECVEKIKESFQSYQREGSGWQLLEVRLLLFFYDKVLPTI